MPEIKKFANIDPNFAPKDIKMLRYLLKPREIAARISQLRESGMTVKDIVLNPNADPLIKQLKTILTPEGVEFAKKNLWGAAGIGAFDEMIESSNDDADNLFKDND